MQLFKRQKFDKSDDNLEYTKQVLTQVTCFNDTMTYVKEQRNRKATAYTLNDPIKDRVIYTGDTLLILTKDKPENTDRLTARASLNGLKLENFDRDALDEYNHTLSDASWEIWKQMNFYGQSLKNHDSGNATGVVDEPVAMVCGTMSLHNYRPDTKFDRNSLCVYMLPDPKKNQPFSENGYSTVYAMSRRVLEIAPMEFVKFRIFPMTSGILNAYHSAFPSTGVRPVGPKTKAVKFGPVLEFGPDKMPKHRVESGKQVKFGEKLMYVYTDREIHGTLRRGTGKDGTIRKDPDKYEREVIYRGSEDVDEEKVDSDDGRRVHLEEDKLDGTSVPLTENEIHQYEDKLKIYKEENFDRGIPELKIIGHSIKNMFQEFNVVINNINLYGMDLTSIAPSLQVSPENIVGPFPKYRDLGEKQSNLFRFIIVGDIKMKDFRDLPEENITALATCQKPYNTAMLQLVQSYRMFISVIIAMIFNYWPRNPPTGEDLEQLLKCIDINYNRNSLIVRDDSIVFNIIAMREPYRTDDDMRDDMLKTAQTDIVNIIQNVKLKKVTRVIDFPDELFKHYSCAFEIIRYLEKLKENTKYAAPTPQAQETTHHRDLNWLKGEAFDDSELFKNLDKLEDEEEKIPDVVDSNNSENQTEGISKTTYNSIMEQERAMQIYIFYKITVEPNSFQIVEDDKILFKPYILAAKMLSNTPRFVEIFQNAASTSSDENINKFKAFVYDNDIYEKFEILLSLVFVTFARPDLKELNSIEIGDLTETSAEDFETYITQEIEKLKNPQPKDYIETILNNLSQEHRAEIKEVTDKVDQFSDKIELISKKIQKIQETQNETLQTYKRILDGPEISEQDSQKVKEMVEVLQSNVDNLITVQKKILEDNAQQLKRPPNWNNSDDHAAYDDAKKWFDFKNELNGMKSRNELLTEIILHGGFQTKNEIMHVDDDKKSQESDAGDDRESDKSDVYDDKYIKIMNVDDDTEVFETSVRFYDIKTSEKEMTEKQVEAVMLKHLYESFDIPISVATKITYDPDDVPEWILDPLESHFKKELENLVFRFCGVEIEPGNSGCRAELFHYPAIKHLFKSE